MTTHTNSSNPIEGIPTGVKEAKIGFFKIEIINYDTTTDDFGQLVGRAENLKGVGKDAFDKSTNSYSSYDFVVDNVGAGTRLCFYPHMSPDTEALTVGNCELSIYIYNIKVQIAK